MHEAELLEREHELTALDALVEATQAGDGRLLVIEGPAGIGKTRLLSGLRRSAERPLRVLAYELWRAAADDGSIRTDLDADLLATFLLSSVRTVTEITMAGTATLHPSGEQLWQLVADGVTT